MQVRDFIQRFSEKPGTEWSDTETEVCKNWLSERSQLQIVWVYAARYLGSRASEQDVEDAVVEFYLMFDRVRKSYRPGGPNFYTYILHVCFKNYCVMTSLKQSRRQGREVPLDHIVDGEDTEYIDTKAFSNPGRRAENRAFSEGVTEFLNAGIITEKQKTVFVLRYFDEMSYEMIAEQVGSPLGSIKGWLNRATIAARLYLEERGWSECHVGK